MFPARTGLTLDPHNVRRAFRRTLKLAELSPHFTPHCLRHTFASLLLSHGKPIVYVKRQLGHASITLTVDTYGKWLPMADRGAVDVLDDPTSDPSGSKTVAKAVEDDLGGRTAPQRRRNDLARSRTYEMGRVGLEPTTRCLKGSCSNHLS